MIVRVRPSAPQLQGGAQRKLFIVPRRGIGDFSSVDSAIQTIEGWFPGSVSYRNNNPGNLRPAGQPGCTPVGGFCSFPTLQAGQDALDNQVSLDASRGLTIAQFAAKYAPAQDSNDPVSYAAQIASATGLSVNDPLSAANSSVVASIPTAGDGTDLSSMVSSLLPSDDSDNTMIYLALGLAAGAVALAVFRS